MLGNLAAPFVAFCVVAWRRSGRVSMLAFASFIAVILGLNSTKHLY